MRQYNAGDGAYQKDTTKLQVLLPIEDAFRAAHRERFEQSRDVVDGCAHRVLPPVRADIAVYWLIVIIRSQET
jgi:hypothetical protein